MTTITPVNSRHYGAYLAAVGATLVKRGAVYTIEGGNMPSDAAVLAHAKTRAKLTLDTAAEAARSAGRTDGATKQETYARKVTEATALADDDDPDEADYPLLSARIGIDGDDLAACAATVLAKYEAEAAVWAEIEALCGTAISAINAATTLAEIDAAIDIDWPTPEGD